MVRHTLKIMQQWPLRHCEVKGQEKIMLSLSMSTDISTFQSIFLFSKMLERGSPAKHLFVKSQQYKHQKKI